MCGFTGFFSNSTELINRNELIKKMSDTIIHRGPDSEGFFVDDCVALGFRRLSIIDLEGGHQPIHSQDGRYVIIFNGEIYNYRELKERLIAENNCVFSTNSDTEVILNTYTVYKEKTAEMLRGLFAFVIYDKQEHTLYGARDYYFPAAVSAAAGTYLQDSIMSNGKTVDSLTAYTVGWTDTLTMGAKGFLDTVAFLTREDLEAAAKAESFTGYGSKFYPNGDEYLGDLELDGCIDSCQYCI